MAELEDGNEELYRRLDALESRLEALEDGATTQEGRVRLLIEKAENLAQDSKRPSHFRHGISSVRRASLGATHTT